MAQWPVGIDRLCCEAGQMYLCDFGADLPACTLDDDSERASDQEFIFRMLELLFFCGSLYSKRFIFHRIVMQPRMRWSIWHSSDSTTALLLEPLPQCVVLDWCSPCSDYAQPTSGSGQGRGRLGRLMQLQANGQLVASSGTL